MLPKYIYRDFYITASDMLKLKRHLKKTINNIEPCPKFANKRGIVMCAGGIKYFTDAWVTISMLRETGCNLPVELFYKGNELNADCIKELKKKKVICRDLNQFGYTNYTGYLLKVLSIFHCSFQEVFFLDADNIPLRNPEFLFELPEYKKYNAIFWPDYTYTSKENPIWEITDVEYRYMREQESGQIVINKAKCWKEMNLCLEMNKLSYIFYRLLLGDKDTFRFSWMALNTPFYFIQKPPGSCGFMNNNKFIGFTMLQYDNRDKPLFLHRNLIKYHATKDNEKKWEIIKSYRTPDSDVRCQISHNGKHYVVDLEGDVLVEKFTDVFDDIEIRCLEHLKFIRNKKFYKDFLFKSFFFNE